MLCRPCMTLDENTEITHLEMRPDEKGGFHSAVCWGPQYAWEDVDGYDGITKAVPGGNVVESFREKNLL